MLKQRLRLAKHNDVKRTLGKGQSFFGPYFTLKFLTRPGGRPPFRFTVIVSNKVSKLAVTRNRLKRLAREFVRPKIVKLPPGDYIVIARPAAATLKREEINQALYQLFLRIK